MPAFERQVLTRTHGSYRGLFWAFSAFGRQRPQRWKAAHSKTMFPEEVATIGGRYS